MSQVIKECKSNIAHIKDIANYEKSTFDNIINPTKYVVIDVETNGLSAIKVGTLYFY